MSLDKFFRKLQLAGKVYFQLPKTKGWSDYYDLVFFQDFWCPSVMVQSVTTLQSSFTFHDEDILLASLPKTGTTWLKALVYCIVNRDKYAPSQTPLLSSSPHVLVPFLELMHFGLGPVLGLPRPEAQPITVGGAGRLWSTHVPYDSLPGSALASACRVLYIARNPIDVLVSGWLFGVDYRENYQQKWTLEEYVDKFCNGEAHMFGPYWSHVLGFWKASQERPDKVLFVKYEDLKSDMVCQVKKILEFAGFPFSEDEERGGVVGEIVELCSLKKMKSLDVNANGELFPMYENKSFFRKGEVGDWVNHLTPAMAKRVNDVVEEKLCGSGLTFKILI